MLPHRTADGGILAGQLGNQRNQWPMQEIAGVHPATAYFLQSVPRFEGNPTVWSSSMKWKRHTLTSSTSCASVDWYLPWDLLESPIKQDHKMQLDPYQTRVAKWWQAQNTNQQMQNKQHPMPIGQGVEIWITWKWYGYIMIYGYIWILYDSISITIYIYHPTKIHTNRGVFFPNIFSPPRLQVLEDGHLTDSKGRIVAGSVRWGRRDYDGYPSGHD